VVWEDWRNGNADIYGYDLSTGEEWKISAETTFEETYGSREMHRFREYFNQKNPAIHQTIVVWSETDRIRGYDLAKEELFSIDMETGWPENPAVYGDVVVWEMSYGNPGIHGYNLETDHTFYIAEEFYEELHPHIHQSIVVWEKRRHSGTVIYAYHMQTGEQFRVNENKTYFFFDLRQHHPALYENSIIWIESNDDAIYGYDLSTDKRFPVALSRLSTCPHDPKWEDAGSMAPAIYGNMVVWVDCRNGNEDIFGYDLSTEKEFQITFNEKSQKSPAIYKTMVVWEDNRHGNWDIYGTDISTLSPTTGIPSRYKLVFRESVFRILVIGSLIVYVFVLGRELFYVLAFFRLKEEVHFQEEMMFKYEKTPSIGRVLLQFGFMSASSGLCIFLSSINSIWFYIAVAFIAIQLVLIVVTIWRMRCPYIYVGHGYILKFPLYPGRWKRIELQFTKKAQFRIKLFELELMDGTTEIIDVLKVHERDQYRLVKTLKKMLWIPPA
jgi:beta propeller repeat protein